MIVKTIVSFIKHYMFRPLRVIIGFSYMKRVLAFYKGSYAVIFIIKGNYADYIVFII